MPSFADLDAIARALPQVEAVLSRHGLPAYRVGGKAFVFRREPRKDAVDPDTGAPMDDVIVVRTPGLDAKDERLADHTLPVFTTAHFDGWPHVLLRERDLHLVPRERLADLVAAAWEAVAPRRLAREHAAARGERQP